MTQSHGSRRVFEDEPTALDAEGVGMVTLAESNLNHFTVQTVAPELQEAIQAKAQQHYQCVIVDISQVEIIDSAGVGSLVAIAGFARQNQIDLHLCSADPKVGRILRIMQLHRVLPIHPTRDAAYKACLAATGE